MLISADKVLAYSKTSGVSLGYGISMLLGITALHCIAGILLE